MFVTFVSVLHLTEPHRAGSIKDSVVGEDRIAQYLLAVLNTRGTPFHWKNSSNRRMEGIQYEAEEKVDYSLKNLRPSRRKLPTKSHVLYVEVMEITICVFVFFFMHHNA